MNRPEKVIHARRSIHRWEGWILRSDDGKRTSIVEAGALAPAPPERLFAAGWSLASEPAMGTRGSQDERSRCG